LDLAVVTVAEMALGLQLLGLLELDGLAQQA